MADSAQNPPPACSGKTWDTSDPAQEELSQLLNLKHDPTLHGVFSLGRDGVFRSLTADRRVVDAVGLAPAQIAMWKARYPPGTLMREAEVDEGADGTQVPREKWFNPDEGILPAPVSREKLEEWEAKRREEEEKDPGCTQRIRDMMVERGQRFA